MLKPQKFSLSGIVPVIPTPFDNEGNVAHAQLRGLMEFAIAGGAAAVCLPAYASEFYKLDDEERVAVVATAVDQARGRLPVLGQVNYFSARQACRMAIRLRDAGASAISASVPRLFALSEEDLFQYFESILQCVDLPLVIQDFNPGGASVSVEFVARLHAAWPQFGHIKLEEPRMAGKVEAIRAATAGGVGVLEGWGGMYMLELLQAGVVAVMPGLALTDLLARIYRAHAEGDGDRAWRVFQAVLPQIVYSLQNLELFHHAEKSLLVARGVLPAAHVRSPQLTPLAGEWAHMAFLNGQILKTLDALAMPHNPAALARH